MAKVKMDSAKIDELLERGVAEVYPSKDALREALQAGKQLRVYNGIDPTGDTLHIGHLASLQKLRQFQELGHEVVMLIGDFTGMIGDPTDKLASRKQQTRDEVNANAKRYEEQASAVLKFGRGGAKIRRNSEWWDGMDVRRFFELLSLTTVQRLLERDMFQDRMKQDKPIGAHEFLYPALQGYDAVEMDVDVEVGGTDQMFNMLMGRDYQRKLNNKEKFVITVPLVSDANGKKIGKTEGNMVELDAAPNDLYGQAMALPDGVIIACFEQCTSLPTSEVQAIEKALAKGGNPRDLKMQLAHTFTAMRYGDDAADAAQEAFVKTFQKHETPEEVVSVSVAKGEWKLIDLLVEVGLETSKSAARRVIE
ncbi:MAG: tyrosine--tRNA ligase, partial [Candidatus Uhrbacteria bacterium]